jgi:large conductance mechanosensitive channel
MPRLSDDDARPDAGAGGGAYDSSDEDDTLLELGERRVRRVWEGFLDFAFQGNVLEIAFGLM